MYTQEVDIYTGINKIMRQQIFDHISFNNFKYYYLALMYSRQKIFKSSKAGFYFVQRFFDI